MIPRPLSLIRFDNHYATLRALGGALVGAAFIDGNGQCIWCDQSDPKHISMLMSAYHRVPSVPRDRVGDIEPVRQVIDDELEVLWVPAYGSNEALVCRLLLVLRRKAVAALEPAGLLPAIARAVTINLINEYELNDELESMAEELSERYEELNLVFRSDTRQTRSLFGLESLRDIVADTTNFLDVGMTGLIMPSRNFELFDYGNERSIREKQSIMQTMAHDGFDRLAERQVPIVINNAGDFEEFGLAGSFSYKCMMVPIRNVANQLIGALLVASHPSKKDFSNSDRNLLEVVGSKVSDFLKMNFDSMTGLENSQSFEWAIEQALVQARTRGQQHAVLNVNIDRTGLVNDLSGRAAGDELIRRVSREMRSALRSHDSVARIGGDEFGVLLETCSIDSAIKIANKLCERMECIHFAWEGNEHVISICIGIAPLTAESDSVSSVLTNASVARDVAKELGRNRVQLYEQNDLELRRRRGEFQWIGRLQAALRKDLFRLHAQLIKPLGPRSDKTPHYEILLRLQGDKGELIAPGQFIPAAEHFQLMPEIDKWVVQQVCATLVSAAKGADTSPVKLSVNLSGQSLSDERVKDFLCRELSRIGNLATFLCFEITESAAIANLEGALSFIASVREYGCQFSLDDFGSGLSSFSYLQRFDVDYLKIDGSFVRLIHEDQVAVAMVSAINQIGQVMGLSTIAEFVENEQIFQVLKGIGVDYAQGFHFSRPTDLDVVLRGCLHSADVAGG